MITMKDMERLLFTGGDVVGDDGKRIGSVSQLFLDARTGHPAWVTVTTGLFGKAESFIPVTGAELRGDALHVPYGKNAVKHAPQIASAEGRLSPAEERELYRHYGLLHDDPDDLENSTDDRADADRTPDGVHDGTDDLRGAGLDDDRHPTGAASPGPLSPAAPATDAVAPVMPTSPGPPPLRTYDEVAAQDATAASHAGSSRAGDDDGGTVLSAEQAHVVGTERVATERVRMRRYTVTEQKEITVPVQREEIRVEYEPADDGVPRDDAVRDDGTVPVDDSHPRHRTPPSTAP